MSSGAQLLVGRGFTLKDSAPRPAWPVNGSPTRRPVAGSHSRTVFHACLRRLFTLEGRVPHVLRSCRWAASGRLRLVVQSQALTADYAGCVEDRRPGARSVGHARRVGDHDHEGRGRRVVPVIEPLKPTRERLMTGKEHWTGGCTRPSRVATSGGRLCGEPRCPETLVHTSSTLAPPWTLRKAPADNHGRDEQRHRCCTSLLDCARRTAG